MSTQEFGFTLSVKPAQTKMGIIPSVIAWIVTAPLYLISFLLGTYYFARPVFDFMFGTAGGTYP